MLDYTENKVKILVVEDNKDIIESFKYVLEKEGFIVQVANTKNMAITYIQNNKFDMFLLDIQLPDGTGFEICKYIKSLLDIPVIFISGRAEETNIVYGLDIGADDYIIKPFGNNELTSRIKSVLRRYQVCKQNENIINYKNLRIDLQTAKVYNNNEDVFLTHLEYKILLMFLNNKNRIITREELLEKVWDIDGNYVNDNSLSVYIKRLRLKIMDKKSQEKQRIQTIRGIGYILN